VSTKRDSKMGSIGTTTTIHQLIFDLSDGLRRANDAMLGLVEYEEFAHQKQSLREDAAQLREFRGEILAYVLETWQQVEEDEADHLRAKRRAREQSEREADLASIAKAQARLKRGKVTQIKRGAQKRKNGKGEVVRTMREKATKVGRH
jgi:predicted aminopeptidase